jgi:hypothetical protein
MNAHNQLTKQLEKSIQLQSAVRESNNLAAENAFFFNAITQVLDNIEKRFLNDPSSLGIGEDDLYKDIAIEMKSRYGRNHIVDVMADAKFNSIMGE